MNVSSPNPLPTEESNGFRTVLGVLQRRWVAIVAIVAACVAVAVVQYERSTPEYQATASVVFNNSNIVDTALQITRESSDPERDAATNVLVAKSPEVAVAVKRQLRTNVSADELRRTISVEAAQNANVLNISSTSTDPVLSQRYANAFAERYIAFQAEGQVASLDDAIESLQNAARAAAPNSEHRASIDAQLQRLQNIRTIAGADTWIIGRAALPSAPTGLSLSSMIMLAVVIGLAIGLTVAFVLESTDRRINSIEDVEATYGLTALAVIPQSSFRGRTAAERSGNLEPYRILRSSLDFASVSSELRTLLVTSAMPSEGKTTVSVDLAQTIALTGQRVVLVELDLRRPTFARHFELDPRVGLTTALLGHASVEDLLVSPFAHIPNFAVLPSGRLPPNPSEIIGSQMLSDTIAELRRGDAVVILDAPPLNPVADAQILLSSRIADTAIVVARIGVTTRDSARRTRAILDRHLFEPLGVVVTGLRNADRYGYVAYHATPGMELVDDNIERFPPAASRRARS